MLPWLRESALCAPRQEQPHPPQRRHIHRCEGRGRSLLPWIREARSVRREGSDLIRRSAGTFTNARAGDAVCCLGFGKARSVRRGRSDPIRRSAGTFTDARAGDALCCHGFGKARSVRREGSDPIRRSAGTFTDVRAGDALCCHGFGKAHPKDFHAGRRARALSLPGARHFAGDCPKPAAAKVARRQSF